MPNHKVQQDGTAGGFKVRRKTPLQALQRRQQLKVLHLPVAVVRPKVLRQFQVEHKLRVRKQAPFALEEERHTAGRHEVLDEVRRNRGLLGGFLDGGFFDPVPNGQPTADHVVPLAGPGLLRVRTLLQPNAQALGRMSDVPVDFDAVVANAEQARGRPVHLEQRFGCALDVVTLVAPSLEGHEHALGTELLQDAVNLLRALGVVAKGRIEFDDVLPGRTGRVITTVTSTLTRNKNYGNDVACTDKGTRNCLCSKHELAIFEVDLEIRVNKFKYLLGH